MKVNKGTACSTSKVLLVPYEASHVTTYHEWMKDPQIQQATASEPLSLEEEYEMQAKWRNDHDKLTFIVCENLSSQEVDELGEIEGGVEDAEERMVGDVNLFLSATEGEEEEGEERMEDDSDEERQVGCIGELELMIAPTSKRRQGYGRSAIITLLHYIAIHLDDIREEFIRGISPPANIRSLTQLSTPSYDHWDHLEKGFQLMVKIGEDNESSVKLFESLGFVREEEKANYFGEVELVLPGYVMVERTKGLMEKFGVEGYEEMAYVSKMMDA